MRAHFLALIAQVAIVTPCVAQLNERLEKLDRGDRGIAEKLTITRGGSVVYERLRLDRDRDGNGYRLAGEGGEAYPTSMTLGSPPARPPTSRQCLR